MKDCRKSIFYNIAGLYFSISSADIITTQNLLPNYQPFLSNNYAGEECLFNINTCKEISVPLSNIKDTISLHNICSEIYTQPEGYTVSTKIDEEEHRMFATRCWKNIDTDITFTKKRELPFIHQFLMCAFGMAAAAYQTIKIHASVIEKNGKALIFLGKSGTGKSTHSNLWLQYVSGCSLLNDDEPIVRLENGIVNIYGSPWSGKTPCYRNVSAKVSAFVHLYQSPQNKLTPVSGIEAFSSLFQSTAILRAGTLNREMIFNTITGILKEIPVYRLDCRADEEAVRLTESLL